MKLVRSLLLASACAALAFAASPAFAADYTVKCPKGAVITYAPQKAGGDVLFHTPPTVISVACNDSFGTQHVLEGGSLGNSPRISLASDEDVGRFLQAIGGFINEQARKKTASK